MTSNTATRTSPAVKRGREAGSVGFLSTFGPSLAVLALLMVVGGLVHANGMADNPHIPIGDDEGTYMSQAWAVLNLDSLTHYTYWYDHPPVAWMLIAGWTGLTGGFDRWTDAIGAGREFMLVVHLISMMLVWGIGRRLGLNRILTSVAVLLFSLSPLAIDYQRAVSIDNIAIMFVLAAFYAALAPKKGLWGFAAAGGFMALAVLSKETAILIAPALALVVWRQSPATTRRFCLTIFFACLVLGFMPYVIFAVLKGELFPGEGHVSLLGAFSSQLTGRGNESIFQEQSGPRGTVEAWLDADPWLLGVGLAAAVLLLMRLRWQAVSLALLIQVVVSVLRPGYLPAPLVIGMIPFAALSIAGLIDAILQWGAQRSESDAPGRSRGFSFTPGLGAAAAMAVVAAVFVVPGWIDKYDPRFNDNPRQSQRDAVAWLSANAPKSSTILVDDNMWVDLVRRGFKTENVVWQWKLSRDPEVKKRYPGSWKDFDYIVLSRVNQSRRPEELPVNDPEVKERTKSLAAFGSGESRIDVRSVPPLVQATASAG